MSDTCRQNEFSRVLRQSFRVAPPPPPPNMSEHSRPAGRSFVSLQSNGTGGIGRSSVAIAEEVSSDEDNNLPSSSTRTPHLTLSTSPPSTSESASDAEFIELVKSKSSKLVGTSFFAYLESQEKEIVKLKESQARLISKYACRRQELVERDKTINTLHQRLGALEKEKESLTFSYDSKIKAAETSKQNMAEQIGQLKEKNINQERNYHQLQNTNKSLESKLNEADNCNKLLTTEKSELLDEKAELLSKNDEQKSLIENFKKDLERKNEKVEQLKMANETLENTLKLEKEKAMASYNKLKTFIEEHFANLKTSVDTDYERFRSLSPHTSGHGEIGNDTTRETDEVEYESVTSVESPSGLQFSAEDDSGYICDDTHEVKPTIIVNCYTEEEEPTQDQASRSQDSRSTSTSLAEAQPRATGSKRTASSIPADNPTTPSTASSSSSKSNAQNLTGSHQKRRRAN